MPGSGLNRSHRARAAFRADYDLLGYHEAIRPATDRRMVLRMSNRVNHKAPAVVLFVVQGILCTTVTSQGREPDDCANEVRNGRRSFATGIVRFWHKGGPITEQRQYVAHFSDNGVMLEQLGNHDRIISGQSIVSPESTASIEEAFFPRSLATTSEVWEYGDSGLMRARATESNMAMAGAWNLRDLGLSPTFFGVPLSAAASTWNLLDVRRDGPNCIVIMTRDDLRKEVTFDATQGFAPVRAAMYKGNELAAEAVSELGFFDGAWYPKKVEFNQKTPNGERRDVVMIEHAEFNRPEHPAQLTPANLGLEVGTNVRWTTADGRHDTRMWSGHEAVSPDEFRRLRRSGEIEYSDRARKYNAEHRGTPQQILKAAVPISRSFETEWAKYTREFCDRYALNEEQRQAANRILNDCEEQARRYFDSRKAEVDALLERWEKAKTATSAPAEIVNRLLAEGLDLKRPVQRIFDERLKPRLETLPTKAQRAAVDAPAASQPK